MKIEHRVSVAFILAAALASSLSGAAITGTVRGTGGKPFMGAFVIAENTQNKMTINVLSNERGQYYIGNLPGVRLLWNDG